MAKPPRVEVRVPRVFCDEAGRFGNPLGVVMDGPTVVADDRQALARHLGYSETVFVDDAATGRIAIYTPEVELPFAGHPSVGTAWMLRDAGFEVDALRPPAGKVGVRFEGETTWVDGASGVVPRMGADPVRIAGGDRLPRRHRDGFFYVWAWIDEEAGLVRARCFVAEAGVDEDEATGSAALPLSHALGRAIEVRQGKGSIIHARPLGDGTVEIGGRVVEG